jgi:hypothetical protein
MKKFNEIKEILSSVEGDADKFFNKGNKAAGTRLRKAMLQVKDLAHEVRKEVTDLKNQE